MSEERKTRLLHMNDDENKLGAKVNCRNLIDAVIASQLLLILISKVYQILRKK